MRFIFFSVALSFFAAVYLARSAIAADTAARPVVTLSPSSDNAGAIQAAWLAGKDVLLSAGVYTIERTIHRPAHASLRGVNRQMVVLLPSSNQDIIEGSRLLPAKYQNDGVNPDGGGISDLTMDATDFPGVPLYRETVSEPGLRFRNLRIIAGAAAAYNSPGASWTNIEFDHSTIASNNDDVTFTNISFFGAPAVDGANEFLIGGNNVTVLHGLWRNTQRGMVIRWAMNNAKFKDLDFEDICASPYNANEVILEESSGPLTNSTFDTIQIHNCRGRPIALDFGGATGNLFARFDIDGGEGVSIGYKHDMGANVFHNHFTEFEMRNVMHFCFNSAHDNVLDNCAIIDPRPSWCSQYTFDPRVYRRQAVIVGADQNFVDYPKTVRVIGLPEGWVIGAGGQ